MNKSDINQSIVLIGPKAVGKTFISSELIKKTEYPVISSDLLTSLLVLNTSTSYNDLPAELKKDNDKYQKLFDFKKLTHFVIEIAKIYKDENLSEKAKKVTMQYWKIRLLEEALNQLKEPIILDLGADIGAVYDMTTEEKKDTEKQMFMPATVITSRQSGFLKQFKNVFYLKPSQEYFFSKNERIINEDNRMYLENPNSYTSFATQEISTDELFSKEKYKLTEKELEKLDSSKKSKLLNKSEIENISNKILSSISLSKNEPSIE